MAILILDILSSGEINAPGKSTLGYTQINYIQKQRRAWAPFTHRDQPT